MKRLLVGLALCVPSVATTMAAAEVETRDTFDVHAGAILLDVDDAALDGGPIAGLALRYIDTRLAVDAVGIAIVGDAEVGYASELVGQLRVGAGLGVVHGWFSASLFGGGAVGSMGRAAPADVFVGGNVAITTSQLWAVWLEGARAFGDGPNHDRLELRVAVPSWQDDSWWSWYVGARYLAFGVVGATTGAAVVLTLGVGPNDKFEALVR
jgi:hypothetical protein